VIRKISELHRCNYGLPHTDISCEPTSSEICTAISNKQFESRSFDQADKNGLLNEWNNAANGNDTEMGRLQKIYHAQRIAYLIVNGWSDPITIDLNGVITDGNHRIRAASFLGRAEIDANVKPN
jgi:hypothetical protein